MILERLVLREPEYCHSATVTQTRNGKKTANQSEKICCLLPIVKNSTNFTRPTHCLPVMA